MEWIKWLYRPSLMRFILIIILIMNTGFIKLLQSDSDEHMMMEEIQSKSRKIAAFVEEKTRNAEEKMKKGEIYSPYDYFRDIDEIETLQMELKFSVWVDIARIQGFMQQWLNKKFDYTDFSRAQSQCISNLQKKGRYKYPDSKFIRSLTGRNFLDWIVDTYIKDIPPALLFLLILVIQDLRRARRSRLLNPFCFVFVLALFPVCFIVMTVRWFKNMGRFIGAKAEIRRRRKINPFVPLGLEDLRRLEEFLARKGVSLSSWRLELFQEGLKPQHSLVLAITATLVFAIIPRDAKAGKICSWEFETLTMQSLSEIHLPRMKIDGKISQDIFSKIWPADGDCIAEKQLIVVPMLLSTPMIVLLFTFFQEVWREIVHIPLSGLFSSVSCFSQHAVTK